MRNVFPLIFIIASGLSLNGCTVLGMVADSQVSSDRRYNHIDPKTGQVKSIEPPALLTELGMAVDGAVIDTVKKLATQDNDKPKELCKHNGYFMECRPAGKQREDLID